MVFDWLLKGQVRERLEDLLEAPKEMINVLTAEEEAIGQMNVRDQEAGEKDIVHLDRLVPMIEESTGKEGEGHQVVLLVEVGVGIKEDQDPLPGQSLMHHQDPDPIDQMTKNIEKNQIKWLKEARRTAKMVVIWAVILKMEKNSERILLNHSPQEHLGDLQIIDKNLTKAPKILIEVHQNLRENKLKKIDVVSKF